ncbi:FAD-dependent monooxygenase [Brevibacterium atlanticum]|uniref:FAD-dependent monooxygenase n=1 Tax=Brevibacterium atlanticum TaxID=2697563 RepID=UPI00142295F9|nr:FAD-dependent monooxygenase [Brevibacterium atlanticum]
MSLRVACVGGGPGGLFFATLLKRNDPSIEVTVFERNRAEDAFGFGVVFSDATLRAINEADDVLHRGLAEHGRHWDEIAVLSKGEKRAFRGNGMAAIHRRTLLPLLHARAEEVGVDLRFASNVPSLEELSDYDVIVGADGANSIVRRTVESELGHSVEEADAKFIWFGTDHMFDGLTFVHRRSEFGNFAAHAYPISDEVSTFIVETDAETWKRAGLDEFDVTQPPGVSDEKTQRFVAELFAEDIDHGSIIVNNSRWANFRTRRSETWHSGNIVLLGDAVHTAHFSVGSGTKMAMEDAIVLARELTADHPDLSAAFEAYEAERVPAVRKIQDSARGGLSWWENFGLYHENMDPTQFAFHFFSRSIGIDRIAPRDPELVETVRSEWASEHGGSAALDSSVRLGGTELSGRLLRDAGSALVCGDDEVPVSDIAGCGQTTGTVIGTDAVLRLQPPSDVRRESPETIAAGTPAGSTVYVIGGDSLDRVRVSEELRFRRGATTVLRIDPGDRLDPETVILSGRADAVVVGGETDD